MPPGLDQRTHFLSQSMINLSTNENNEKVSLDHHAEASEHCGGKEAKASSLTESGDLLSARLVIAARGAARST